MADAVRLALTEDPASPATAQRLRAQVLDADILARVAERLRLGLLRRPSPLAERAAAIAESASQIGSSVAAPTGTHIGERSCT